MQLKVPVKGQLSRRMVVSDTRNVSSSDKKRTIIPPSHLNCLIVIIIHSLLAVTTIAKASLKDWTGPRLVC